MDMFLTTILRTGKENDYLFRFLVPRRDGSIDVTEKFIRQSKVPYFWAFRALDHQRQRADLTVKIALSEQINRSGRRVE